MGFTFIKSFWVNVGLFSLYGVIFAIIDGNQRAFVSDMSSLHQATSLGYFYTAISIGVFLSNIIAGILWQLFSPFYTFLYEAIMSFLAFSIFVSQDNQYKPEVITK